MSRPPARVEYTVSGHYKETPLKLNILHYTNIVRLRHVDHDGHGVLGPTNWWLISETLLKHVCSYSRQVEGYLVALQRGINNEMHVGFLQPVRVQS